MILIADSGSTKTDWAFLSGDGTIQRQQTPGINPFYQSRDEIFRVIQEVRFTGVHTIYYYGAGCVNEEKNQLIRAELLTVFPGAQAEVCSDLVGAARALCGREKGIACIVGTGSNSCLYDGDQIVHNVSPLGFILGDEGSGANLGRRLVSDLLKNQLPQHIAQRFFEKYPLTIPEILERVYKQAFPNRFLAGFTVFLKENLQEPVIQEMVKAGFADFFRRNIRQYENYQELPVHFVGSIAWHFQEQLLEVARMEQIKIGTISQSPMDGLVTYHQTR